MAETIESILRRRWSSLASGEMWHAVPDANAGDDMGHAACYDLLADRYGDPRRAYHNQQHLLECLEELNAAVHLCEDAIAVELALWFHDAIYDPARTDNESASADLAASRLAQFVDEPERISRVREMILDTAHRREPATPDGRLIVDIDLSILGKPPARFDAYDAAIGTEYAHVPAAAYRAGRAAVLRAFLDRRTIYRLPHFVAKYECQARANLARAISRLQSD